MKKKVIIGLGILLAIILLFPITYSYRDGGTIEHRAILYSVIKMHQINPDPGSEQDYLEGAIIQIFGIEVYNDVK